MQPGFDGGDNHDLCFTLEESLGVTFDDDFPFEAESVAELFDVIDPQVHCAPNAPANSLACPTAQAFYSFRRSVQKVDTTVAQEIVPAADLEVLVPEKERPHFWNELNKAGLQLPHLRFPPRTIGLIYAVSGIGICLCALAHFMLWPSTLWLQLLIWPVVIVALAISANRVLWRWTRDIPKPLNTVRGMATYLAYRDCKPDWVPRLTKRQVETVVTLAVALEFDQSLEEVRQRLLESRHIESNAA